MRPVLCSLACAVFTFAHAGATEAQMFDPRPLREPIAMSAAPLPTDAAGFSAWLATPALQLSEAELSTAREHLFSIISADAKQRFVDGRSMFPRGGDSTIAHLFGIADQLGIHGAALVAAAADPSELRSTSWIEPAPGFRLSFDSMYALVAEADGWRIQFPHYFMIGGMTRQRLANDVETSVVILSTLFAKDKRDASQATIMIVSGAASAPDMTAFWLNQFGIPLTDTVDVPNPSALRAYHTYDDELELFKEMVVFAPQDRTILFAYIGLPGTFEANRHHFVDLLDTLRIRQ